MKKKRMTPYEAFLVVACIGFTGAIAIAFVMDTAYIQYLYWRRALIIWYIALIILKTGGVIWTSVGYLIFLAGLAASIIILRGIIWLVDLLRE
jgi:hypothetical protein